MAVNQDGAAMNRDADCIQNARECLLIAANTKDEYVRQEFIEMARNWVMVALCDGTSTTIIQYH